MIYKKPNWLDITIKADDPTLVDLRIRLVRGGKLHLHLQKGEEVDWKPFAFNLPVRDQRDWIIDKDGFKPAAPGIFGDD